MSIIAVTGASGFLGREVVRELNVHEHTVRRIGRGADGLMIDLDRPELRQPFDGVEAVAHLAGALAASPETTVGHYLTPNVQLTEQVFLDAVRGGADRFVFSSSRLVYGSDLGRSAVETDPPSPATAYGLSKYFAERVVQHQSALTGIRAASLRVSQLVGRGDGNRGVLARFSESAFSERPVTVSGRGVAVRDFLDVRDAASAVRRALDAMVHGQIPAVLNVGGGPRSIAALAEIACDAAGVPHDRIAFASVADEDESHWSLDSTLAGTTIDWRPAHDLTESLREQRTGIGDRGA